MRFEQYPMKLPWKVHGIIHMTPCDVPWDPVGSLMAVPCNVFYHVPWRVPTGYVRFYYIL